MNLRLQVHRCTQLPSICLAIKLIDELISDKLFINLTLFFHELKIFEMTGKYEQP